MCFSANLLAGTVYQRQRAVEQSRALRIGLDEKAIEAIRNYRFKPAMKDGRPVPSAITVEVDFRLF